MRFGINSVPVATTLAASLAALVLIVGAAPAFASFGAFAYDEATGKSVPAGVNPARSRPMKLL